MNSFEDEADELFDWSTKELERIDKEYPGEPGVLDGPQMAENKKHFREYNRRLLALKDKYGIDAAATG